MVQLRFFGHSFFKIGFKGKNVLVDPFIGKTNGNPDFSCLQTPQLSEKDLSKIDVILVSHEHFDHFDPDLLARIANQNNACIVGHESLIGSLPVSKRLLHPISTNETLQVRGLRVTAVTAHHPQSFYPMGFIIEGDSTRVFHAGDTDLIDDFAHFQADVALLPIGGYETMDCVDAVRATKAMKPRIVIPMHYNTFKMINADPLEFKQKIEKSILKTQAVILKPNSNFKF